MILNELQVESIKNHLKAGRIFNSLVYDDILDHICCIVEERMDRGDSFEDALEYSFRILSLSEIKKTEMETLKLININKYRIKKILSYLPEVVFLLFSLTWIFDLSQGFCTWVTWITIGWSALLIVMILFRSRLFATLSALVSGMVSFSLLLVVLNGLDKVFTGDSISVWQWVAYVVMCLGMMALSFIMPWKYIFKEG